MYHPVRKAVLKLVGNVIWILAWTSMQATNADWKASVNSMMLFRRRRPMLKLLRGLNANWIVSPSSRPLLPRLRPYCHGPTVTATIVAVNTVRSAIRVARKRQNAKTDYSL